ncbi:MAG TPA: isoprenylcysteine carboxylmethyltransferase family protein [Candidatus Baltobacteraceae bacterium]|nr:isoprenylcysteine carboxylmethyltransferase family protein [Candidatus Baltobacteraceae bacterium]
MKAIARILLVFVFASLYLALAIAGFGGVVAFFSDTAMIALTGVFFAFCVVAYFAGGSVNPGVREDRANRWVIWVILIVALIDAYVPAWCDRHEFWTIDGETTRWLGVVLIVLGGTLRILPVFILGYRFSGLVAIQPGHQLKTNGLYGVIRHPSYLGLLITMFGWGLAFRSWIGVLIGLLFVPIIVARIVSEERLLQSQFGAQYDAYRAHTWRLIPRVY